MPKYLAFYFPQETSDGTLLVWLMTDAERFLDKANNIVLSGGGVTGLVGRVVNLGENRVKLSFQWPGDLAEIDDAEIRFTGRVFVYSENHMPQDLLSHLTELAGSKGLYLIYRGPEYAAERNRFEKPRAFISHDSRDKETIARPIATRLQNMYCRVWYDEFSLSVGDSLRGSIEEGLKTSHMCIFIITPHFLSKGGWTKREYDAIFTRELVEERKLILPVWAGVSRGEVYEYSPILADRVAIHWESGEEEVCRQLFKKLVP